MSEFRVGMCGKCNERVWLTPNGCCSRGHGAAPIQSIEDVAAPATPLPKTVFCRSCGSELFETVAVCGNCGTAQIPGQSAGQGAGPTGATGAQPGAQPSGATFSSQRWVVGSSAMGVSASSVPPLDSAPDFSVLDPYYQDEFRRIYESGEVYRGKWNWAAFIFGPFWLLFRDMPLIGIAYFLAEIVISAVTAGTGTPLIIVAYRVYLGIRGNYLRYTSLYKRVQTFIE